MLFLRLDCSLPHKSHKWVLWPHAYLIFLSSQNCVLNRENISLWSNWSTKHHFRIFAWLNCWPRLASRSSRRPQVKEGKALLLPVTPVSCSAKSRWEPGQELQAWALSVSKRTDYFLFCPQLSLSPSPLSVIINVHTCMIFYDTAHLLKRSSCHVSDLLSCVYVMRHHGKNEIGLLL